MKIYLIRHAEEGEDGGLSDLGRQQATALGKCLKDKNLNALFSSDRPRALETAEIVGEGLNLSNQIIPNFEEVRELDVLESTLESQGRAERGLLWAIGKSPNQNIAVVAHSKLTRQLLDKLNLRKFVEGEDLPNTGIVVLEYQDGNFDLLDYGLTP